MEIDNLKILICDDSILARKQLKDIILALGTPTFYEAPDGQKAIDTYKKVKPGQNNKVFQIHRIYICNSRSYGIPYRKHERNT